MISILPATTPEQIAQVRALFLDYAASLKFDLGFQGFERELAELPGDYAPPKGRLLLAYLNHEAVGCAALHEQSGEIGEMKRLYVKPSARGHGIGRRLSEEIIRAAAEIGYTRIRLDTIADQMQEAVAMYRKQGFVDIPPYRHNPIAGALYMELCINDQR
jgi:putative acetyltransferase